MPPDVAPQVDVGSLTLQGLSAVAPFLSALTADNVDPTTLIQLDGLGSLFHVNGPYAAKVPNMLQRCSSKSLDRIATVIGWRKGDAASVMAQSPGGQAMALICFCLDNICKKGDMALVLYDLSEKIFGRSLPVHSSIKQLEDATNLLSAKMQVLGFGNILAEQVVRIQDVYLQLNIPLPHDFFDVLTRESTVELFHSLWIVFQDKETLLRISGVHAMGHITAVILILFPENVMLIVEGLLVREGPHPSIILEVDSSSTSASPTTIQIERRLEHSSGAPLRLEFIATEVDHAYTFKWSGHIADALEIEFMNAGFGCSEDLRSACTGFLVSSLPSLVAGAQVSESENEWPLNGIMDLLGSNPTQRVSRICSDIFRVEPPDMTKDFTTAYAYLIDEFRKVLGSRCICTCLGGDRCDVTKGWPVLSRSTTIESQRSCMLRRLWLNIGAALEHGYCCLLIDARPNSVLTVDISTISDNSTVMLKQINPAIAGGNFPPPTIWCSSLHRSVMTSTGAEYGEDPPLIGAHAGCTLLPVALLDVHVDIAQGYRYRLLDGMLVVKGRYYKKLYSSIPAVRRSEAPSSVPAHKDLIRPSSWGEHTSIAFTVQETSHSLKLKTTVLVSGHSVHLNLTDIIIASIGLIDAPACKHDRSNALDPATANVKMTSIANVQTNNGTLAIVQTKGNPTAQMLACDRGVISVIQRTCCLNCAVEHATKLNAQQVIVAI